MDSKKLALLCRELADNRKAENIVVLDVRKISSVTDYFVIVSGTSEPHLRAIMDEISDTLREEHDITPTGKDGTINTSWVVLDYFDVMIHIMRVDARERYDLESLWNDAPRVKPGKSAKAAPAVEAIETAKAAEPKTKPKAKRASKAKKKSAPES
jgi:ribosome-associated protein